MKKAIYTSAVLIIGLSVSVSFGQKGKTKSPKPPVNQQAQTPPQPQTQTPEPIQQGSTKTTPAYIELVNRKVEVEAEYKELLVDYTEEHPKVKITKAELTSINYEMAKMVVMDVSMIPKLTQAFGKIILRKIELEKDVNELLLKLSEVHPTVIKAKEKVAIMEQEIQKILQ